MNILGYDGGAKNGDGDEYIDRDDLCGRLEQAIDRYGEVIRQHRDVEKRFSEAELNTLREVVNGWHARPASIIASQLAIELDDAMDIACKWGVRGTDLLEKVRALPYADALALVAGIEEYWRKC